jgi:hypothetical protein
VAELISRNGSRIIRVLCNPGTLIIEIPDEGNMQLGEKVQVTGSIHIESVQSTENTT